MALTYFNEVVRNVQQLWLTDGASLGTHVVATFSCARSVRWPMKIKLHDVGVHGRMEQ